MSADAESTKLPRVMGPVRLADRPRRLAPWVALWTVLFLLVNRAPILGRGAPIWDAKDSFFPFFVLVADHARAGRIVSWDIWSNAGLPRIGDPEFGAVWPLQLLVGLAFGGTPAGFIAYWMTVWWLGGFGIFLLARHLRAPPWAAFIAASGYAWSGIYTGHAEHISWLVGFSSLPYVIWRLDAALTTRRWLPALQSGAIWGAAATAAYPGVTIATAGLMAVWTVCRVTISPDANTPTGGFGPRSPALHGALVLVAAGLVGLLCLSPTYVSFFREGAGVHVRREPLPRSEAVDNNALDPGALVTGISPHFASLKYHRTSPPLWRTTDVSSVSIYPGAATLALAIAALLMAPRSGWRWFLAALALLWIGIAVGSVLPLRGWLYDWVYPTRFFRHAALFRLYFVFTVTVLALLAAADVGRMLQNAGPLRRRFGAALLIVAAVAGVVYWAALPVEASRLADADLGRWHLVVVWGGMAAVGALVLAEQKRMSLLPTLLVSLACVDAFMTAALTRHTMFSSTPGDVAWFHGEAQLHEPSVDRTRDGLVRTLQACESNPPCTELNTWGMITKVPALSTYTASTNPFFDLTVEDPLLARSAIGRERIWFSSDVARVDLDPEVFRRFIDRTRALGGVPVMVHSEPSMLDPSRRADAVPGETLERLPAAVRIPVTVNRYTTDALDVTVETPSAGWLLVTERWARSWRAEVDGQPARILGGNFVFRAIEVPEGRHRVEFTFAPLALPWLVAASWTTMLGVAVASVWAGRRQRA